MSNLPAMKMWCSRLQFQRPFHTLHLLLLLLSHLLPHPLNQNLFIPNRSRTQSSLEPLHSPMDYNTLLLSHNTLSLRQLYHVLHLAPLQHTLHPLFVCPRLPHIHTLLQHPPWRLFILRRRRQMWERHQNKSHRRHILQLEVLTLPKTKMGLCWGNTCSLHNHTHSITLQIVCQPVLATALLGLHLRH